MTKEQLIQRVEEVKEKLASENTDFTFEELKYLELKPKFMRLLQAALFQLNQGSFELLTASVITSLEVELNKLLDHLNRLPGENSLLRGISSLYDSILQYLPSLYASTYDLAGYKKRFEDVDHITKKAEQLYKNATQLSSRTKTRLDETVQHATKILANVSTSVLSKQISDYLRSPWNTVIVFLYILALVLSLAWMIEYSASVSEALKANEDFSLTKLIIAWVAKLPVAFIFVFAAILLRAWVKYNEELRYRMAVAGALDAQIKVIYNNADALERAKGDEVRLQAISLYVEVIKQFSSSPSSSSEQELKVDVSRFIALTAKDKFNTGG